MNSFKDLDDFIDLAEKNRKYPENTAQGLRAALKVFGKELKPDEFSSIDLIEERFDEIFLEVLNSNKDKFSIDSLNTYKMRFIKIMRDYRKYGQNPSNMQNWVVKQREIRKSPQPIQSKPVKKDKPDIEKDTSPSSPSAVINTSVYNEHKIELALRPDAKFTLLLPRNINESEAQTLKAIIDSLIQK
jgi:hypothetical protein